MNVQVKSSNGITLVPIESKLMTNRRVFIEDRIDRAMACEFVKKVMLLNDEDSQKPIYVFINSEGGDINSGMLIYDVIQASKAPIVTFCMGMAYSMGAVLFACGNHGRYISPHGELMIHEPLLGNSVSGNSSSIKSVSDCLLKNKKMLNQILAKHTGQSEEAVEEATSYDHYFNPEESIEFGLCDEIIDFSKIMGG